MGTDTALRALMIAALDGNAEAYRTVLTEMRRQLKLFFGRRLRPGSGEIEDLVQETLIAIHTRRATYDRACPIEPWLFAIARHKLIDHFRRLGSRPPAVSLDGIDVIDTATDATDAIDARRDLEVALALLPPRTRALVESVKLRELSHAQAAAANGMTEAAVKVAVHRGLRRMRAHFTAEPDDDGTRR